MNEMSIKARDAQRAYKKRWRAANKDKVKAANQRYWERRAEKEADKQNEQTKGN